MTNHSNLSRSGQPEKPVLITMHMKNHAQRSGYDRLADHLRGTLLVKPEELSIMDRIVSRAFRRMIRRSGSEWYHRDSLVTELRAARKWLGSRNRIFHFLYGENQYRYLGGMKRLSGSNAIICTYHTPPGRFMEVVRNRDHLKALDAIVVMSMSQRSFFADMVGEEKVHFIPHGVDTGYFRPGDGGHPDGKGIEVLSVGHHLRDFQTLAAAARRVNAETDAIRFTVVAPRHRHHHFSGLDNVRLLSGVPDDMLLQLYQRADLFALPLLESTANNVLLEAMACGRPIIATDLPGVRDYVSDECASLVPKGDAARLAETIIELSGNEERRRRMSTAGREQANRFRWERIAERTMDLYQEILQNP